VTNPDVDRANRVITLKERKTAHKTGLARRIPIGRKLVELLDEAIDDRSEGPVFRGPSGRGWRIGNLSRNYSRLRDLAGLPKDLVLYCLLSTLSLSRRRRIRPSIVGPHKHHDNPEVHASGRIGVEGRAGFD